MLFDNKYKRIYDTKWNFKDGSMKELIHGIHPYPAMMMPLIAREMFKKYGLKEETVFLDPYVGSGTTLVEAQYYGAKKAIGFDLNPLAILISQTKTTAIDLEEVKYMLCCFEKYINNEPKVIVPEFSIRDSWFNSKTIHDLAIIRSFIFEIENNIIQNFFKVAFSETVRLVSETRNGEFKLYRMSKKSLENFNPNAIETFKSIIERNIKYFYNVNYKSNTMIELYNESSTELYNYSNLKESVNLVITSPPYGDSHTTVAYGQFSRLSNEWLGMNEAGSLDRRLLGGKRVDNRSFDIPELNDAIVQIRENDKEFNRERCWEVVAFYNDYEENIKAVSKTVKLGGYVIYVVGNRRVRNVELPLDIITYKMFEKYGFEHINTYVRDILNKRMPSKASPLNAKGGQISTMMYEYIVVMKRTKVKI